MSNLPDTQYEYRYENPKKKVVDTCISCGSFIYEGESYYDIKGMIICTECMERFERIAQGGDERKGQ